MEKFTKSWLHAICPVFRDFLCGTGSIVIPPKHEHGCGFVPTLVFGPEICVYLIWSIRRSSAGSEYEVVLRDVKMVWPDITSVLRNLIGDELKNLVRQVLIVLVRR
jgi:hypothetical protein